MSLSIFYFSLVCVLAVIVVMLTVSVVNPEKPRIKGLYIIGFSLVYAAMSLFFADLWGDLLNKWYGQWPAFTFGIIFGIPALVVTTCTALSMLGSAIYTIIKGRFPAWIETVSSGSLLSRLGIAMTTVFILVVVGGSLLGIVLRNP